MDPPDDAGTDSDGDSDAGSSSGETTDARDAGGISLPEPGTWNGEVPPGCVVEILPRETGCYAIVTCGQFDAYASCMPRGDGWTCTGNRDDVERLDLPLAQYHDYRIDGFDVPQDACVFAATLTVLGGPKVNTADEPVCALTTEVSADTCERREGCTYAFEYASQPVSVWTPTTHQSMRCTLDDEGVHCSCSQRERGAAGQYVSYHMTDVPLDRACETTAELCEIGFGEQRTDDSVCETQSYTGGEQFCAGSISCVTQLELPEGGEVRTYPYFYVPCFFLHPKTGGQGWDCSCMDDGEAAAGYNFGWIPEAPCGEAVALCNSLDEQPLTGAPTCSSWGSRSWFEDGQCRAALRCGAPVETALAVRGSHGATVEARCVTNVEGDWDCGCEDAFDAATESYVIDPGDDPDRACVEVRTRCQEHIESAGMAAQPPDGQQ